MLFFMTLAVILVASVSVNAQQAKVSSEVGKTHRTPKGVGAVSGSNNFCFGWSFCTSITWTDPSQTGNTFQTMNSDSSMTFKIPFASMNAENLNFYHNKTTFELKDNSPFQLGERRLFGLKPTATYLAGVYQLVNDGNNIVFTVRYVE